MRTDGGERRGGRRRRAAARRCRGAARRGARRLGFAAPARGFGRRGGAGAVADLAEQGADRDRLAVLGGDLGEHAGGRRGHLDRHLVGLELDQRLVGRDGVAAS